MRDIKFRAWDNYNSGFIDDFYFGTNGSIIKYSSAQGRYYELNKGNYVICQYVGLHDKNGKEIYEGDIVQWDYYKKKRIGKVAYSGVGFWVIGCLDVLSELFARYKNLEVIGNIYENSELVNG